MSNLLVQNIKHTNNTTSMTVDSSGQVSVRGEGSATTTNLQQGLAKMWTHADQTGTAEIKDSFNTSSITDVDTSDMKYTSTNNMSNTNYAVTLCYQPINNNNGTDHFNVFAGQTTSTNESRHYENGSTYDLDNQINMRHGDLA